MDPVTATARPRVGLLGNPSDGYGGRVIAFTFDDFAAAVTVRARRDGGDDPVSVDLMDAAVTVFTEHAESVGAGPAVLDQRDARHDYVMSLASDIPRQVGFAGSSAIVIAALRALSRWFAMPVDPVTLARLALWAETRVLGIQAGPQDRVVQAHGGVFDMDFATSEWGVTPLDVDLIPPLLLAWTRSPGASSGGVHDDIKQRFDAGDPAVIAAMDVFPQLAREGALCLSGGDLEGLRALVDRNFDQRATIWTLDAQDLAMVELGRRHGAAVKFCGSGGGVVAVPESVDDLDVLERVYADAGFAILRPTVTRGGTAGGT
ncbi:MAG: hypothetical protein VX913_15520 [Planctomycetota bacterium]|nr:hypothetical protein [Planctomycetota bacterium]